MAPLPEKKMDGLNFGGDGGAGGVPIEQWYYDIPVVTRTYATLSVITSLLCQLKWINPLQLFFDVNLVFRQREYWRLITTFVYFGTFGLDFLFYLFFLVRYCRMLEEGSFRGRTYDFAWMLGLGGCALLVLAPIVHLIFLGSSLTFMMVYIWSRRNPDVRMNFLGLFTFNAPFLPWVLMGFSLLLNNHFPVNDGIGIVLGHIYYFFDDVYPFIRTQAPGAVTVSVDQRRYLRAPAIVRRLFEVPSLLTQPPPELDNGQQQQDPAEQNNINNALALHDHQHQE